MREGDAGARRPGERAPRRETSEQRSGGWRERRATGPSSGRAERPTPDRGGSARSRDEERAPWRRDEGARRSDDPRGRAPQGDRSAHRADRPSGSRRPDRAADTRSWQDREHRDRGAPDRRVAGERRERAAGDWRERRPSDAAGRRPWGDVDSRAGDRPRRPAGPEIPEWADARELDPAVRSALRSLDARNAERVARHLVAAGTLVDEDPEAALEQARAARDRASRVAAVREAVGVAAYHAGDYAEAARELRAYRRMSGDDAYRAVLADCERAVGRPEVALRLVSEALAGGPDADEVVELRLVESGARRDLGEAAAARLVLERALGGRPRPEMVADADAATLRLAAAYADLLVELGEADRAAEWTAALVEVDPEGLLGVGDGPQVTFTEEDVLAPSDGSAASTADVSGESAPEEESFAAEVEAEVAELLGETDDGADTGNRQDGEPPSH